MQLLTSPNCSVCMLLLFVHTQITTDVMAHYRNTGGFDMLGSGRDKIESPAQMAASLAVCKELDLDGLIVIGGDDSNTNAAILAEYFAANGCKTSVCGCPKVKCCTQ
jgi:diphosphate-dependent phosphofructokinase